MEESYASNDFLIWEPFKGHWSCWILC